MFKSYPTNQKLKKKKQQPIVNTNSKTILISVEETTLYIVRYSKPRFCKKKLSVSKIQRALSSLPAPPPSV